MTAFATNPFGGIAGIGGIAWGGMFPASSLSPTDAPAHDDPVKPADPIPRPNATDWNVFSGPGSFPGFDAAPPSSIALFWQMRRYTTIVLAYAITTAPIFAGVQTVDVVDDCGNPELAEQMQQEAMQDVLPVVAGAMPAACECLHFGHWLQELAWDRRNGRTVPCETRSILPGEAVLYRDQYRRFAGYQINNEYRDARYAIHVVNNDHINPIVGEARNEWVREEWWRIRQSELKSDKTESKASGIQIAVGTPQGFSLTASDGSSVNGAKFAQTLINSAVQGQCFSYNSLPFKYEDVIAHPELIGKSATTISPIDWGNTGPALAASMNRVASLKTDIMRGWRRPEREAMEGQHGTKAEAGTQGAIGTLDSEYVADFILKQMTAQVLDRWRVTNYGLNAPKLRIKQNPLTDPTQEYLQKVYLALLGGTTPDPEALAQIDIRRVAERTEVPIKSQEDTDAAMEEQKEQQAAKDQQKADAMKAMAGNGMNGNMNGNAMNGKQPPADSEDETAAAAGENGRVKLSADIADRLAEYLR